MADEYKENNESELRSTISDSFSGSFEHWEHDINYNVAGALLEVARGLNAIASALRGIEESISSAKVGSALDGLASLQYKE